MNKIKSAEKETADTKQVIETFENIVNSNISQKVLNGALTYCDKCGETRLESALRHIVGLQDNICFKCELLVPPIKLIIKKGLSTFDTSEESFMRAMQDETWIRGLVTTFQGMAKFGVQKPFVPGAPYQIVWNITRKCNFKCIHCYENAGKKGPDECSPDEIKAGIKKLADSGVISLAFSGGEPTTDPHLVEYVKYATDLGLYVSLATNGYICAKKEKAQELADAGLKFVQISLDGLNPKTHDEFRRVPGSWEHAVQAIDNFNDTDVFVEVSTTVTQNNKDEIPDMIDFMRKKKVGWFMLYNFIPTGKGSEARELDLSPEDRFELLNLIYQENGKGDLQVLSTAPQFADVAIHTNPEDVDRDDGKTLIPTHFYNVEYSNPAMMELSRFIGGCGAGRFYLGIEPNGDIYPCVFFPHDHVLKLGNIKKDNLDDIWINNNVLKELRDKDALKDSCSQCESRFICGGCRARAYTITGDYLAGDPGCVKYEEYMAKHNSN